MTPGEEVTVSDGQGMDYFCRIAELTKEEVRLDIVDSWHSFVELPAKIYLFQGLPKADKMELIIQKAVEVQQDDTPEILQRRVMEQAEWKIMPQAIRLIAEGKVRVENGKTIITE